MVTDAELAIELLHMTDRYTDEIFKHAVRQGDAIVEFPVSRLVLDPERFVEDDKEAMAARGMGVVYLRRHDGSALRADLTQKAALVRDYYEPHHRLLDECVSQHLRTFGRAIIIDCHSFPSVPLPYELVQDQQRPEICIGTDPVHTPEWLSAARMNIATTLWFVLSGSFIFGSFWVVNHQNRTSAEMVLLMYTLKTKRSALVLCGQPQTAATSNARRNCVSKDAGRCPWMTGPSAGAASRRRLTPTRPSGNGVISCRPETKRRAALSFRSRRRAPRRSTRRGHLAPDRFFRPSACA